MSFQFELPLPGVGKDPIVDLSNTKLMQRIKDLIGLELRKLKTKKFSSPSAKTIARKLRKKSTSPGRGFFDTGTFMSTLSVKWDGKCVTVDGQYYAKYHREVFGFIKGSVIKAVMQAMSEWEPCLK